MTEKDWIRGQVRLLFGARPPIILERRVVARFSVLNIRDVRQFTAYGEEEGGGVEGVEKGRGRRRRREGGGDGEEEER